jgi:hypothetical protein
MQRTLHTLKFMKKTFFQYLCFNAPRRKLCKNLMYRDAVLAGSYYWLHGLVKECNELSDKILSICYLL